MLRLIRSRASEDVLFHLILVSSVQTECLPHGDTVPAWQPHNRTPNLLSTEWMQKGSVCTEAKGNKKMENKKPVNHWNTCVCTNINRLLCVCLAKAGSWLTYQTWYKYYCYELSSIVPEESRLWNREAIFKALPHVQPPQPLSPPLPTNIV